MEKEDLIVHLLRENRVDVKEIRDDISEMKVDVALNRQDLEKHMRRSDAIENLALTVREEANSRIQTIENKLTVRYLLKLIVSVTSGIGIVSGAAYGVIKLLNLI